MRSGPPLNYTVQEHTSKGIRVVTPQGTIQIPWSQVSPSYPKHPDYVAPASRPARPPVSAAGDVKAPAPAGPPPRPGADPAASAASAGPVTLGVLAGDPQSYALLLLLLLFWVNIGCVWRVSCDSETSGNTYQAWNLFCLLFGPLALAVYAVRYGGGLRAFFGGDPQVRAKAEAAEACLYTWDSVPIKSTANRTLATGLTMAEDLIGRAVQIDASDIHFNTVTDGVTMAFRVDGVLRAPEKLSVDDGKRILTAIKTAAGMDLGKLHEAQDGACHFTCREQWYDLRIARAYAVTGETIVVRILRAGGRGADLTDLGMFPKMAEAVRRLARETAGIIVLAGPTGSGKTTTIYALLRQIVGTGRNILTIEDPVEYRLDGTTQISINSRAGGTFAGTLKASLRHAPDVILVGEIRDSETMDVAFQAGLTGHLVFTSIHASSLLAGFGRLRELGLSEYLINTGLKAIVCQRLVRRLCPTCRQGYVPDLVELDYWGLKPDPEKPFFFYRPAGCPLCEGTGYHGRTAIYRVLIMNNAIRGKIRPDVAVGEIQAVIEEYALGQLRDYAREWLSAGLTSTEEFAKHVEMFDYGKQLGHAESASPPLPPPAPPVPPPPPGAAGTAGGAATP